MKRLEEDEDAGVNEIDRRVVEAREFESTFGAPRGERERERLFMRMRSIYTRSYRAYEMFH